VILGTLTSTFFILMKFRFLTFHQNCFRFYNICWRRFFFHRSVSNGTGEGGNLEEKDRKIICLFEKKTFQLFKCFFIVRVNVSSLLVILILSFLDDVLSLFSNVTIHSFDCKDKIPQPLYLEFHLN
jgi:hypothetical protein